MLGFTWDGFLEGPRAVVAILAFRLFPFAGYVAITRSHSWAVRVAVVAAYAGVSLLAMRGGATSVLWLLSAYAYCATAGWVAYELSPHLRSRVVWFATLAALFWALPLAVVRPLPTVFLVLGWDVTLSAYSYGVETRERTDRALRGFLFFLLVNPVLVYPNRGSEFRTCGPDLRAMLRVALGVSAVLLAVSFLEPLHARAVSNRGPTTLEPSVVSLGLTRLAGEYAAQSGVASIQIAIMRQLGYELPERFLLPFLARSPAEFWRRWNTYVGDWARRYVFLPLVRALAGRPRSRRLGAPLAYALSVVVTFALVGVLHDAFVVAETGVFQVPATAWFTGVGAVVVTWEALCGRLRANDSRGGHAVERAFFTVVATCAAAQLWW